MGVVSAAAGELQPGPIRVFHPAAAHFLQREYSPCRSTTDTHAKIAAKSAALQ